MNVNFENNEFFRQLPEETKEKLRNCKTEEEAMDVLKGDMVRIPDDALDAVAGGREYWCMDTNCSPHDDLNDD